ncbi:MAG: SNF2-related protein, partial [Pseudonocardiaceae bacterium]
MTRGRLRLNPLEQAGYRTVADVLTASQARLEQVPGVGPQTASQVIAAARQLAVAAAHNTTVRLDPDQPGEAETGLLALLSAVMRAEEIAAALRARVERTDVEVRRLLPEARPAASRLRMAFARKRTRGAALDAVRQVQQFLTHPDVAGFATEIQQRTAELDTWRPEPRQLWRDYQSRAAAYHALLSGLGDRERDVDAHHGFVPKDLARQVTDHALDGRYLRVSLRGYQAFHSALIAWRLHGPGRDAALRVWTHEGGIGVTTFETLRDVRLPDTVEVHMLVVDEAHYAKNPAAQRSRAVARTAERARRVLFMTGTPMENRVEEFRTLVSYLRPGLAAQIRATDAVSGAKAFRKAVAPVYLRRNAEDVLSELPERLEMDDWVEFGLDDFRAYRDAVASGNFMAMRRAAFAPGSAARTAKLVRLLDIVDESAANGWKVVVFSFFRDVLSTVHAAVGDAAYGPLTGSIPPTARQGLIDEFTRASGHAVLVSQIDAGGVG